MKAILLGIIVGISSLEIAWADAQSQAINLSIVSRCGASVVLEKAQVSSEDGRPIAEVPLTRLGPFFYGGHVSVAPGRYLVGASAGSKCFGGAEITVLPNRDRNMGIVVAPLGNGHYDAHAFLYGTLPFAGFVRGSLVGEKFEIPIEVDVGAYYAEHAYPGKYLLKLSYGDSLECRLPVVVPQQGTGTRLDISVQQTQQCLGFPYRIPSTGERGFIQLFPSPSPSPQ
jgi:hypothetical protein